MRSKLRGLQYGQKENATENPQTALSLHIHLILDCSIQEEEANQVDMIVYYLIRASSV